MTETITDTAETIAAMTDDAAPITPAIDAEQTTAGGEKEPAPGRKGARPASAAGAVLRIAEAADLWHDADRNGYATIEIAGHRESWPLKSRECKIWLAGAFYERSSGAVSNQAIEDALRILEARAIYEGEQHEANIRIGRVGDTLYLDLADDRWRAVEITADGWRIVDRPAVKFLRAPAMRPLPEPKPGKTVAALRPFVNVKGDADFMLVTAWMVAALRERGPYPILAVNGEQGTGKSMFSRMIRSLIDPSAAPIRAVPKDDRDLIVSASNSHVLAFDNLSSVPAWLSDALCRLATGGGFATRMLHTDRDEMIFEAQRPIILNGIPALTDRADLADRALNVHLSPIPDESRRPEDELMAAFAQEAPYILGALLDGAACAMRNLPQTKIERSPRMADFVKWTSAAMPQFGWNAAAFTQTYRDNRRDVSDSAFEADPVASAIRDFMAARPAEPWIGTPTALLAEIANYATETVRKSRLWPLTPQSLGNRIDRAAPLLRAKGFAIDRRHSGVRTITIIPPGAKGQDDPGGASAVVGDSPSRRTVPARYPPHGDDDMYPPV
jgi:hypothetical protein